MSTDDFPIAIVGLSYRAPGVGHKGLFEYLSEAKSAFSRVPSDRFEQDAFSHPDHTKAGTFTSKGGHFLPDDIYKFNASFFGLRAEETRAMDPHHRMILECAWEAAENAGLTFQDVAGSDMGVFSAMGVPEHGQQVTGDLASSSAWSCAGDGLCMHANRVSYFFNLGGPSVTIDTACASGAHAVHMACQSLRTGECKSAFVNAAHLILGPNEWILLDTMGALSPEGRCFSYDVKASGFGRGEGAVSFVIKPLQDAMDNGDPIHAIIRNSACNHSGRSDGITMPSRPAQERLLRRVHKEIGLDPSDTPVVEGHGTGTPAGDPIEAGAFSSVLGEKNTPDDPLYIGSVKSNFGHLEGASGVMGMVKAILMLQNDCILPNADFEEMSQKIDGRDKLVVAKTMMPWPKDAARRVVVTSFGFGGSNAAIILERAPANTLLKTTPHKPLTNGHPVTNGDTPPLTNGKSNVINDTSKQILANGTSTDSRRRLFVFSSKTETSLASYLSSMAQYLESDDASSSNSELGRDLSYTLGQRRTHHTYRVAVTTDSLASLKTQILVSKASKARDRSLTFVFTGQGAQHAQMACSLRGRYKIFSDALDRAEKCIRDMGASWSLREELEKSPDESRIHDAEISQPACTAVQLACVVLFEKWGIVPGTVTGHSSGEISAAFAAGLLSFETAMAVAYFRGQAAAEMSSKKGAMLALGASVEEARGLLDQVVGVVVDKAEETGSGGGYATIAAINSPSSVTVSGDEDVITRIKELADSRGLFARKLNIQVAYHSRHMEAVSAHYLEHIKPYYSRSSSGSSSVVPDEDGGGGRRKATFVSSVTGQIESSDTVDASYWVRNLVQPVRFSDAIKFIYSSDEMENAERRRSGKLADVVVEIGPHSALKTPIQQSAEWVRDHQAGHQQQSRITYLPSLVRGKDGDETLLEMAGSLFATGFPVDLGEVNQTDKKTARVLSNLPSYSWDKSVRYTLQSWVTQQRLLPGQPFDPLIGWKLPQSIGNDHVFGQVFTLDEMPWIRDHNLGGTAVFPMTAYLSMAIEAVRRVSSTAATAAAAAAVMSSAPTILIRECYLKSPLLIEEDERVTITTKASPTMTGTETRSSTTWNFEILSWAEATGWTTHCYGQAEPEATEMSMESANFSSLVPLLESPTLEELDVEQEYATQEKNGMVFGPEFRSMRKLLSGGSWTVIESELRNGLGESSSSSQPSQFGSKIVVDPPTMDGFIHGAGPLAKEEDTGRRVAWMPIHISRLRVSNRIPGGKGQRFTSISRRQSLDPKAGMLKFSTVAFAQCEGGSLMPIVEYESMSYRPTASSESSSMDQTATARGLPWSLYWDTIPVLESCKDEEQVARVLQLEPEDDEAVHAQRRNRLNAAATYYMKRALKETEGVVDPAQLPAHLSRFLEWSKMIVASQEYPISEDEEEMSHMLAKVAKADAQGEMLCAVGENLGRIFRGEVEPLEIMMKDGLLTRHYESDKDNLRTSRHLAKFVGHFSDMRPDMRILEIGGGTGSATLPVLQELSSRGGRDSSSPSSPDNDNDPGFLHYTFTDISSGFFDNARSKLSEWSSRMTYKKLDISQDPLVQGFSPEEKYDLIIASNVLHATPDIGKTMDHVRKLLDPSGPGKLLLLEVVHTLPLALPFVLLPGWWLSEDEYRCSSSGPLLSREKWDRVLLDRGFAGVESHLSDNRDNSSSPSSSPPLLTIMSSTRLPSSSSSSSSTTTTTITITGPFATEQEVSFAESLATSLSSSSPFPSSSSTLPPPAITLKPFSELEEEEDSDANSNSFYIVLDSPSPSPSILSTLNEGEESFQTLKTFLLGSSAAASSILWVIPGSHDPEAETIKGMIRTLRLEDEAQGRGDKRGLFLLEGVDYFPGGQEGEEEEKGGEKVISELAARLLREGGKGKGTRDGDFIWKKEQGMLHVPRLRRKVEAREVFASEQGLPVRKVRGLWDEDKEDEEGAALEMTMDVAGSLEGIYFKRGESIRGGKGLGDGEVLVKIEAAGVNFRDLLVVLNSVPGVGLGGEAAGVVLETGSSVKNVEKGDRVFFAAVGGGSYATHFKLDSWRVLKIPKGMTAPEAASLPVAYLTALVALMRVARLERGEKVLIHAGSGAVGQACIVLAKHIGAEIFSTAGTTMKRDFLRETYGIPQSHIFSSRNSEFRDGILGVTGGYGVDVVVNCLSGNLLQESWGIVADFGRFVEIGKKDFLQNSHLGMRPFNRNVTFSGVDASTLFGQRPDQLKICLEQLDSLLKSGVVIPINPVTVLPISELGTALRKLQAGQNIGKLVVTLGPDERVLAECPPMLKTPSGGVLSPDATYVITGGTGGIGLSLGPWMVENGARNVVLLGRSGSSRPEVQKVLQRYQDREDVTMRAIACDVGSRDDLVNVLSQIQDMPPVRGVVHGALFLRDALLVNATFEDWQNVTTPRIQGARNLDELFPNLDFFIMLSSFLGATGNIGQTIYAGTATFFDAFADDRKSRGLTAVSIALPVILDVGFVADRDLTDKLKNSLGVVLSEPDLQTLVKGAIIGPSSGLNEDGRAISFSYALGDDRIAPRWKHIHPQAFMKYINSKDRDDDDANGESGKGGKTSTELKHASDVTLLDALITRVSSITMIEKDEVEPDVPLAVYSLDSLISLELRNWIRRETGVDLSLPKIVGSENLRALAANILLQREAMSKGA